MNERLPVLMILLAIMSCNSGCVRPPPLSTEYGRSSGIGLTSVNGTSAMVKLFRESGKRVSVSRRLGDLVSAADVVVWVPDSYDLPRRTVTRYFDAWLSEKPGRRLIYVAKNYDGAVEYWRVMAKRKPDDLLVQRELARALTRAEVESAPHRETALCDWFRLTRTPRTAKSVDGGRWLRLLDDSTDIADRTVRSGAYLMPHDADVSLEGAETTDGPSDEIARSDHFRALLADGEQILAAAYRRSHWRDSHVLLFSTGDWLLNLPLARPGAQLVAERVLTECGSARRVVFLESGPNGPQISDGKSKHHALEAFTVRPFNSILVHLTILGMLFCCAVFPIFGRPRPLAEAGGSDFRRHVLALGELLTRTGDTQYARTCRDYYWTKVRRESGISNSDRAANATSSVETMEGNPFAAPDNEAGGKQVPLANSGEEADRMSGDLSARGEPDDDSETTDSRDHSNDLGTD